MRYLMLLALLPLTGFAASGDPVFPAPGTYRYNHQFQVNLVKRYEVVYAFTEEGRERLTELRTDGYICESHSRDIYQCAMPVPADSLYPEITERVERDLAVAELTFGEVRGPAEPIHKGELTTDWSMPQAVTFRGHHYDSYRFLLTGNLQRIFLGEQGEEVIVVGDDGRLSYSVTESFRQSQKVSFRAFGEAGFAP